jgi:hypothetical protein
VACFVDTVHGITNHNDVQAAVRQSEEQDYSANEGKKIIMAMDQ